MKRLLSILGFLAVLAIVGAVAAYALAERALHAPKDPTAAPVELTVPRGTSARALGALLEREGLITDARLWRYHLMRRGGLGVKAGRYKLSAAQTIPELAQALAGPPLPEDVPFTVVEGWRLRDTDAALAAAKLLPAGAWVRAASQPARYRAPFPLPADSLEGYLYPETYGVVPERVTPESLVQAQLDTFVKRFWEPNRDELAKSRRSLHELVTMASILEREEPDPAQRPLVAGILWKRFDARTPLGVDATSRYELEEWNDRRAFLKRLRDPSDRWNTRTRAGLPPGPIGSPTLASLLSALRPVESEYWYYLHDAQRRLHPSRNAAEHEALRKQYDVY